jgi:formylglycine-generating enzyme
MGNMHNGHAKRFSAFISLTFFLVMANLSFAADTPSAFKDSYTAMEFVFVKGGCFEMGNTFRYEYIGLEPAHEVCLDDYYLGAYEVTQEQWEKVMGNNPSRFKEGTNHPVETVSWNDAQQFIEKLNVRNGRQYRLPTEAEWEYAARSGGKKERYAGTDIEEELGEYAWFEKNAGGKTHPVGQKRPNELGLYDMSGNVWEWCSDWHDQDYYKNCIRTNPMGPSSGEKRVFRGGSWRNGPPHVRTSGRARLAPSRQGASLGFRVGFSAR